MELIDELLALSKELTKILTQDKYDIVKKYVAIEAKVQQFKKDEEANLAEMELSYKKEDKPKGKIDKPVIEQPDDDIFADDDKAIKPSDTKPAEADDFDPLSDSPTEKEEEDSSDLPF